MKRILVVALLAFLVPASLEVQAQRFPIPRPPIPVRPPPIGIKPPPIGGIRPPTGVKPPIGKVPRVPFGIPGGKGTIPIIPRGTRIPLLIPVEVPPPTTRLHIPTGETPKVLPRPEELLSGGRTPNPKALGASINRTLHDLGSDPLTQAHWKLVEVRLAYPEEVPLAGDVPLPRDLVGDRLPLPLRRVCKACEALSALSHGFEAEAQLEPGLLRQKLLDIHAESPKLADQLRLALAGKAAQSGNMEAETALRDLKLELPRLGGNPPVKQHDTLDLLIPEAPEASTAPQRESVSKGLGALPKDARPEAERVYRHRDAQVRWYHDFNYTMSHNHVHLARLAGGQPQATGSNEDEEQQRKRRQKRQAAETAVARTLKRPLRPSESVIIAQMARDGLVSVEAIVAEFEKLEREDRS
jgi:hypothetical protein